ncbi:thioredoxin family protein [Streptomyces sp. NPDC020792]|uniref:thioredoxin family protein n=1 Tax=Streptomyces sp. NPDC020792 TaxID=3365089 RepID=UPI0037A83176
MFEVTSAEQFNAVLRKYPRVVVMFTALWCGPCRLIKPEFEDLSTDSDYRNVTFLSIDVDAKPGLAHNAGITSVPTFQTYRDGQKMDDLLGANPEALRRMVRKLAATF